MKTFFIVIAPGAGIKFNFDSQRKIEKYFKISTVTIEKVILQEPGKNTAGYLNKI